MLDYRAQTFLAVYRLRSFTRAAEALHITASDLAELGLADAVVPDLGLTHAEIAHDLMRQVELALAELSGLAPDELVARRYDKFRAMGGDRTCSL